jgi:hypothetical protein
MNRALVDDFPAEEYLPPRAEKEDRSYYSQVFAIKFTDTKIELNEQVFYRVNLDTKRQLGTQSVFLEAKLLWQNHATKKKDKYPVSLSSHPSSTSHPATKCLPLTRPESTTSTKVRGIYS